MPKFSDYFEQGLIRLDDLASLNLEDGYPLVPVIARNWKQSEKRLLIIVESVDRADLKDKKLLTTRLGDRKNLENPMTHLLPLLLDRSQLMTSQAMYAPEDHSSETEFSVGVVNFNAARSFELEGQERKTMNRSFAARCLKVIKKLRPTHVLVCGDTATLNLLEAMNHKEVPNCHIKRGWVLDCELGGHSFKLTPTLDLESVYNPRTSEDGDDDDNDQADKYAIADLLYFVARNITNLLADKHLYSLRHITPNPKYIDTIDKFEAMMEDINRPDVKLLSVDSETAGLESYANKIYFIQFAYSEDFGYVLPIQHPKSPFDKDEQAHILHTLRKFFGRRKKLKKLAFLNGMFDTRVFRAQLRLNVIHHTFIEVTGAESLLDENMGLFARAKWRVDNQSVRTSYQNLRNMFCLYGNDLYYTLPFSKEERDTCGAVQPDNRDLLNYCSLDAQALVGILRMQKRRAKHTYVKPSYESDYEPYYPWFIRHLENQMANTAEGISMMEQAGSPVDVEYLKLLMSKQSPLYKEMNRIEIELRGTDALHEAEKKLAVKFGRSSGGLFGGSSKAVFFDFSKKEHLEILFFDVLKLDPVLMTKTGQRSIDKNFIKQYADDVHEVALFGAYIKTQKLLSTYVKGWYKKILGSVDSARRHTLNPGFGFFTVVTGRLNSFNPSLQQVPSRGATAKYIKRMFRSMKGCLNLKYDYSAQEVRQWSVLSGDEGVAASFRAGLELRRQWIVEPNPEIKARLKKEGDVHIQNVFRFFKKWVEKSDPLRDAVKAIVFGVIYGKSAKTLARDLKKDALSNAMNDVRAARKLVKVATEKDALKEAKGKLEAAEQKIAEIEAKDWVEYAEDIMDQMFQDFSAGADFLQQSADQAVEDLHVMSPMGRRRNLWRSLTGRPGVIAAARRRAQNSPIQGFSSELGSSAGVLIQRSTNSFMEDFEYDPELFPSYCRAVHDCNVFHTPYEMVIPHIHIIQYEATYGLQTWAENTFGRKFTIVPEIEVEVSATDDNSQKWDWSLNNLAECLTVALEDQIKLGDIESPKELADAYKKITYPWRNAEQRAFLQEHYPLLDVKGLDKQIDGFLADFKTRVTGLKAKFEEKEKLAA